MIGPAAGEVNPPRYATGPADNVVREPRNRAQGDWRVLLGHGLEGRVGVQLMILFVFMGNSLLFSIGCS